MSRFTDRIRRRLNVSNGDGDDVAAGGGGVLRTPPDALPVAGSRPSSTATTPTRRSRSTTRASGVEPEEEEGGKRTVKIPLGKSHHAYSDAHKQQAERLGYTNSELEDVFRINTRTCSACGYGTTLWKAATVNELLTYQCRNEVACAIRQMRQEQGQ